MNKSVQFYPVLSFLTFYMIEITSKSMFAVFGIFLYVAAGIALLAYLESSSRNKKLDIISIIAYIVFTSLMFLLPQLQGVLAKTGLTLNNSNLQIWWMPAYFLVIFLPVYFLYLNRKHMKPLYVPVLLATFVPALLAGAILVFFADIRNNAIEIMKNIIQVSVINNLEEVKKQVELDEYYANILSYITINKDQIAKQIIYMLPSALSSVFILITYMTDRMKPIFRDNIIIIRDFRLPDNLVWFLIAGGFLILVPNIDIKYVSYNVLLLFAILYFFQGLQLVNKSLNRYNVSFFTRSLLFISIFFFFMEIAAVIVLIGLFSIWYKPKWLVEENIEIKEIDLSALDKINDKIEKKEDKEEDKENRDKDNLNGK